MLGFAALGEVALAEQPSAAAVVTTRVSDGHWDFAKPRARLYIRAREQPARDLAVIRVAAGQRTELGTDTAQIGLARSNSIRLSVIESAVPDIASITVSASDDEEVIQMFTYIMASELDRTPSPASR